MTREEKRFLKWLAIAAIWTALVWKLTDWGFLGSAGAGLTLFLIGHGIFRHRNEAAAKQSARVRSAAETALWLKFGNWTLLAKYGPLALFVVMGEVHRAWPNRVTFRLLMGSLTFFFIEGLYLCYLVAVYKADMKGENDDGKTL